MYLIDVDGFFDIDCKDKSMELLECMCLSSLGKVQPRLSKWSDVVETIEKLIIFYKKPMQRFARVNQLLFCETLIAMKNEIKYLNENS